MRAYVIGSVAGVLAAICWMSPMPPAFAPRPQAPAASGAGLPGAHIHVMTPKLPGLTVPAAHEPKPLPAIHLLDRARQDLMAPV